MKKTKFKQKMKSIRTKLLVSLVGICLVPMIGIGISAYYQSKDILVDKLESTSSQLVREVNRGIDNELIAKGNNVLMLTNNLNSINIESNPEFLPYLMDALKGVKDSNQNIENVYMGTESKNFFCYPEVELPADYDPTTRPWYTSAIVNKGKVVFGEPYISASDDKIVVSISKTVEKDGVIVGVIAMDIDFTALSRSLAEIKIGNDGYAMLLGAKGLLLAHPDETLIGTDEFTKLSIWNEVKEKGEGFTTYEYDGSQKYAVYTKSPVTGWMVVGSMEMNELNKDTGVILQMLTVFSSVAGILALGLALLITHFLTSNISKIKRVMAKASEGDLTEVVVIKSNDEIGALARDFNTMIANISSMLRSVDLSSQTMLDTSSNLTAMTEETTASVSEVSRAIDEITQGTADQASNTQEAASEMEELAVGLEQISNSTAEMNSISENTRVLSNKGLDIVKFLMDKSEETKKTTQAVSEIVEDMSQSTLEISIISDAINQITEQTNLLSLNASIEAARAGDAGKGFAVVANEIRTLAEQSQNSTEQIKKIIERIQSKSSTAVSAMEQAKRNVADQDKTVEETTDIFNEIYTSVNSLMSMVQSVKQQVLNINNQKEEVANQIESISSISEETAASTEEVSASAEEITATMEEFNQYVMGLQNLAEKLNDELGKFKLSKVDDII